MGGKTWPRRKLQWIEWLLLLGLGAALCTWEWGRVGDIYGDFGGELCEFWQVSLGRVLYRDVAYQFGPLSVYFNALWMRLLGPRPATVLAANLLVLFLTVVLLYRLLRVMASPGCAWVATMFFLPMFAFSSITSITNYNFLTPYKHGLTHGLLLCLAMIECLRQFHHRRRIIFAAGAGLMCGLAFLTKPEVFLAAAAAGGLGLAAILMRPGIHRRPACAAALISAAAPPVLAFILLASCIPASMALRGVLGGWQFVGRRDIDAVPFYTQMRGTDDVSASLAQMGRSLGWDFVVVGPVVAGAWLVGRRPRLGAGVGAGGAILLFLLVRYVDRVNRQFWADADRPLLLFAIFAVAISGWRLIRPAADPADENRRITRWSFCVLSLAFLAKIFLNVRTYHYGFVLAAPVALLTVAALLDWIPRAIDRRGGCGRVMRLAMIGLLAGMAVNRIAQTDSILQDRTLSIPMVWGGTPFVTRPINAPVVALTSWLIYSPPGTTVAALPYQLGGINYASGRSNPTPYYDLLPYTFRMWGEQSVLRAFQAAPPDLFLISNLDADVYGAHRFGVDYGVDVYRWITSHYRPVRRFGPPGESVSFVVWQRQ